MMLLNEAQSCSVRSYDRNRVAWMWSKDLPPDYDKRVMGNPCVFNFWAERKFPKECMLVVLKGSIERMQYPKHRDMVEKIHDRAIRRAKITLLRGDHKRGWLGDKRSQERVDIATKFSHRCCQRLGRHYPRQRYSCSLLGTGFSYINGERAYLEDWEELQMVELLAGANKTFKLLDKLNKLRGEIS